MAAVARLEDTVRAYRAVTEADGYDVVDRLERLIMSVRMLEDRELSALVTFAARHDLLAMPAAQAADRLHQLNWDVYARRYRVQEARRAIVFDWATTEPGRAFELAGDYIYNVLEAHPTSPTSCER